MPEAHPFSHAPSSGRRIDVGDLIRQVSEILAAERPLAQNVTELCTLFARAFGARCASILLDDEERPTEYRYDVPLGLAGDGDEYAESVPLQIGQRSIGALTIVPRGHDGLCAADVSALETCARYIAVGLRNARLSHANDDLERLIEVDPLTEVGNRRRFDQSIAAEWRRGSRNKEPLSVVMIDVDYFKEFNDRYGHVAGDVCLQAIAKAISASTMRGSDIVTRYGGEEFAVLLAETALPGAVAVAENIRLAVDKLQIPHAGSSIGTVSISAGVATVTPASAEEWAALVESADLALYRAKSAGRNRIVAGDYVSEGSAVARREISTGTPLPIPLTTFLGRRDEIAQVERMLKATRLLTLVGPGGVGKTRLALEVAAARAGERTVTFVDLAPCGCADGVSTAIAAAFGLHDEPGRSTQETIASHLQTYGGLIILDNCEHVLAECARLGELFVRSASGVTIVATSREPLGIRGEGVFRLPTLAVPCKGEPLSPQEALGFDALHLFADRAKLVDPGFEITNENVELVAQICRRLDGIPLAIELAAPRLRMMTLEQIERGLDERFSLLCNGARNALPRQKTLHALVAWGYDLLSPREQTALRWLSVLVGSWSIEAARAIAAGDLLAEAEIFDVVTSLVDKSLINAEPKGGTTRYSSLESTRAFAFDALEASGESDDAARAHLRYFRQLVTDTLDAPQRDDAAAFATIRREYANVCGAVRWALAHPEDLDLGLRLVESLWAFWQGSGRYREASHWLQRVLDLGIDEERSRPFAVWLTKATMNLGDPQGTLVHALPLIDLCVGAHDGRGLHVARRMAASAYFEMNDVAAARTQIETMLAEPCAGIEERALTLGYLGYIEMREEHAEAAARFLSEAIALDVPPGLRSWLHEYYAIALFLSDRRDEAIEYARKSLAYEDGVHNATRVALSSLTLAWCWIECGEYGRARLALRRAVREPTLATRPDYFCACFEAFALLALEAGETARAATLLGFAKAQRERREVRPPFDRVLAMLAQAECKIEATIGLPAFTAALQRGGWLSIEAATNESLAT
ncbi:MAG: diguanylate cyclase [Candidatus Tyrphobacter sp.]